VRGDLGARWQCYLWVEVTAWQAGTGVLAPLSGWPGTVAGGRDDQAKRMNTYCFFYVSSSLLWAEEMNLGVQNGGMLPRWLITTSTSASQHA
jgi:hypothetical protein